MPLGSSFWLDETATVFVARHGSDHPSLNAVAPQAWQSIYYSVARFFGPSEISYRQPSVLAMGLALLLIARLAKRLIHPEASWIAVFACLALSGINYEAGDARPYALGILVMCASVLFLVRWMESDKWTDAVGFVICAALLWRVHLVFWPCYLVFLYKPRRRVFLLLAIVAGTLTPVLFDAIALAQDAAAHAFATPPGLGDLLKGLQWRLILGCAVGGWLLRRTGIKAPGWSLIAVWWLAQPVCLFIYSLASGNSVFVPRYLSIGLPGAALAATATAAWFLPVEKLRTFAVVLGLVALASGGRWTEPWPKHHNSDWRAAAAAVNANVESEQTPVLCPSPYLEAKPPAWNPNYTMPGFLYSHLDVYPVKGRVVPLPYQKIDAIPQQTGRFLLYGWEPQIHALRDRIQADPAYADWRMQRLGPFADVDVVVFHPPK